MTPAHSPRHDTRPSDYARVVIDRSHARSMVATSTGVVASEHPLASQAGASVLAAGGHAVDAAIAANAVMGVVAPMMNGVGGDLFAVVHEAADQTVHGLNASGWAPAGLTPALLAQVGHLEMPQAGVHAVTVPGAVAGWAALHGRFGRLPLAKVLAPAMSVARGGFPVSELTAAEWQGSESTLRGSASATRTFLPRDRPPRVGEMFCNADVAWTYEQIAAGGREAFYEGDIARRLLACTSGLGGVMQEGDLKDFQPEWVTPLSIQYRGWTVHELPPNGQGIAALMMLGILSHFDLARYGPSSAEALHAIIEAKKLAYADMRRHLADPRLVNVPVSELLAPDYARARAATIDPWQAKAEVRAGAIPTKGSDTTYLAVRDRHGNAVSLIQSNFANFGTGIVPDGLGFALQNRGGLFTLDPTQPNVLAPRKRPLHTIIPGFMSREGTTVAFGVMGGWNQAQAHAQFVSNVVDHGMNIQAALDAPRVTKLTFDGCDVLVEDRVASGVRAKLTGFGHDVVVLGSYSSLVGGGQSVMRDAHGTNYGASDPRKDGAAVPEPFTV
ncbi:MAG TPA: gamma-glutamyltransferase [Vicinamibacterales bacterium]